MFSLALKAFTELLRINPLLARGDFPAIHKLVRSCPVATNRRSGPRADQLAAAVDRACIWFWKEVSCLHRAAATVCLLRKHGVAAELVIGAQAIPFKAHAWVEVGGQAINDKPDISQIYPVLERC